MLTRTATIVGGAAALLVTAIAAAGPLESNRLPADTTWVMHVDFQQMRQSTIGRLILDDEMGLEIDDMREDFEHELGFDPFEEAMDMTVHGGRSADDAPVIIMTATPVLDTIVQHIEDDGKDYGRLIVDGYTLHTWFEHDDGEQMYLQMSSIRRDTQRRAVVSNSMSRLLLTLKTMQRKAPDVTRVKQSKLDIAPRLGSLLYVQCASLHAMPEIDIDDHIKDACGRVTFEISEHQDRSRVELAATADSEDRAQTVSEIMQGLIALGKLITGANEDVKPLINILGATTSTSVNSEVSIRFEVPSNELREMLHAGHGRDRDHQTHHRRDDDGDHHHDHEHHE